jgi:anti-sigma regulatory factor (Ser/Thr protein kinase)
MAPGVPRYTFEAHPGMSSGFSDRAPAAQGALLAPDSFPFRVFAGVLDEVPVARKWLVGRLPGGSEHPAAYDLGLIGDEFFANAVRHTASGGPGGEFTVVYTTDHLGRPGVGVYDLGSDTVPTPKQPDIEAMGRPDAHAPDGISLGLYGVSQLAAAWGSDPLPDGGRYTWARVAL